MLHCLTDYEPKILLAFGESLKRQTKFADFLLHNGFPELAALFWLYTPIGRSTLAIEQRLSEFAVLSNAMITNP